MVGGGSSSRDGNKLAQRDFDCEGDEREKQGGREEGKGKKENAVQALLARGDEVGHFKTQSTAPKWF